MAGERILIVEDSTIVVLHLKSVLKAAHYDVIATVATAEDAIVLAERERPDLIMMDIVLGGEMDGITASEVIRKKWKIPIIYLTALTDRSTIERAKYTAPLNYIMKPFEERDILTRIELSLFKDQLEKEKERVRMATLIEGQEMERERVSRELHDGLGQVLNAIKLNIDSIGDGDLDAVKEKISVLINEAVSESRRMSENLLPLKLLDFDLVTCIESLCKQSTSDKISIVFQPQFFGKLDINQHKLTLYRITQEALSNAIKHSGCSKIYVQLYYIEDEITLSIEDNGKGFNKDKFSDKGQGLKNIRYRVEILKGKLEIESSERAGTLIHVSMPITQEQNEKN